MKTSTKRLLASVEAAMKRGDEVTEILLKNGRRELTEEERNRLLKALREPVSERESDGS